MKIKSSVLPFAALSVVLIMAVARAHHPEGLRHDRSQIIHRPSESGVRVDSAYSVQMHVHGSFSEGPGSMSLHTHEARDANVDVIWWSDHDFRTTYYHHVSKFSCDDWSEPIAAGEPWTPNRTPEERRVKELVRDSCAGLAFMDAAITTARASEGTASFRLEAESAEAQFQRCLYRLAAENRRHMRTLAAQVSIELAIFPEQLDADARPIVRVILSKHPANGLLGRTTYNLQYFLDNTAGTPFRRGSTYYIPLPYVLGEWNQYNLPVTENAVDGFPFIAAEDNALYELHLGAESRSNHRVIAYFDDVRINHVLQGDALFARQRTLLDNLETGVPEVVQLQGTEVSYEDPHLNEFTVDSVLHDYDLLAGLSGYLDANGQITDLAAYQVFVAQYVVNSAHARDGVVSYNHAFGTSNSDGTREQIRDELLANQVYGCDILEVGYRDRAGHTLADYLWVWDQLALNGLFFVGTGVSDTHGFGEAGFWQTDTNNFVSWIYAAAPAKADLIAGLKRGRVFFGDIALFGGHMDLTTPLGFAMGQMIVTDKLQEDVTVGIDGLSVGDSIVIVENGAPAATYTAAGPTFSQVHTAAIDPLIGSFVRVEVYDAGGCQKTTPPPACSCEGAAPSDPIHRAVHCEKVFSNPIYFMPHVPLGGISSYKAGVDLGGAYSTLIEGFTLADACLCGLPGSEEMMLTGVADAGHIEFNCAGYAPEVHAEFVGLTGSWSYEAPVLILDALQGQGSILIHPGPEPVTCADIVDFSAACNAQRLTVQVRLRDSRHDGKTLALDVNGRAFAVPIRGDRARKNLRNRSGVQTITLTDPPDCRPPIVADCQ